MDAGDTTDGAKSARDLRRRGLAALALGLGLIAAGVRAPAAGGQAMELQSAAFAPGGEIPRRHTCEGEDVSPPLAWDGLPEGTRSLALIVDDPDAPDPAAPRRTWVHWVVYDVPSTAAGLPAGGPLPAGAREGTNDFGQTGWNGPCPPIGRHRYVFKLYALDVPSLSLSRPTKAALEAAMEGHVVARAERVGTYQKRR